MKYNAELEDSYSNLFAEFRQQIKSNVDKHKVCSMFKLTKEEHELIRDWFGEELNMYHLMKYDEGKNYMVLEDEMTKYSTVYMREFEKFVFNFENREFDKHRMMYIAYSRKPLILLYESKKLDENDKPIYNNYLCVLAPFIFD